MLKMRKSIVQIAVTFLLVAGLGCTSNTSLQPATGGSIGGPIVRQADPLSRVVEVLVDRGRLIEVTDRDPELNRIRLIKTFTRASEQGGDNYPKYRMFDIQPNGVYSLLGLRSADTLLAAHDYVVQSPNTFVEYVRLLRNEKESRIQILRHNEPIVLHITING